MIHLISAPVARADGRPRASFLQHPYFGSNIQLLFCRPTPGPVSYTHLDVYKRQDDGRLLVLGAGGGLELKALAETRPGWRLDGVDPSADMLRQASAPLGELAPRATLHQGYIEDAPEGPFDGATCLLTLHFLPAAERLRTVREVARRLRPGAPFIVAHHSFPLERRDAWLARNCLLYTSRCV